MCYIQHRASPNDDGKNKNHIFENVSTLFAVDGMVYNVIKEEGFQHITVECYNPVQDKWNLKTEMFVPYGLHLYSMRIYKAFLSAHQLERFVRWTTSRSLNSLDSLPGPTTTRSRASCKCKCFIL